MNYSGLRGGMNVNKEKKSNLEAYYICIEGASRNENI